LISFLGIKFVVEIRVLVPPINYVMNSLEVTFHDGSRENMPQTTEGEVVIKNSSQEIVAFY